MIPANVLTENREEQRGLEEPSASRAPSGPGRETKISLIIPALNEARSIGSVLDSLPAGLFGQVIVVDNGSADGTGEIARARGATVVREECRGYGRACLAGIARLAPDSEIVVFMDADSSDDPKDVYPLLAPIWSGEADLVLGARRGATVERGALTLPQRMGNALATGLIWLLYRHRFTDLGPFRAIRRRRLQPLAMRDENYGWTVEMQVKALQRGLRVREVPVHYRRRIGTSKISGHPWNAFEAGLKILWTIFRLRWACFG